MNNLRTRNNSSLCRYRTFDDLHHATFPTLTASSQSIPDHLLASISASLRFARASAATAPEDVSSASTLTISDLLSLSLYPSFLIRHDALWLLSVSSSHRVSPALVVPISCPSLLQPFFMHSCRSMTSRHSSQCPYVCNRIGFKSRNLTA